jgi:hypothetical protein
MNRRNFVRTAAVSAGAASIGMSRLTLAQDSELQPIWAKSQSVMTRPCGVCRPGSGNRLSPPRTAG